jgi:hypothetical protein
MLRAALCVLVMMTLGMSNTHSLAQQQSREQLRAAQEAEDARLRAETRKRIDEQVKRDQVRREEREAEQRRRAGVPEPRTSQPPPAR